MKFYKILCFIFILSSCDTNQKEYNKSIEIDFKELNSFVRDSLPSVIELDENFSDVYEKWDNLSLINSVKNIKLSDPRQLNYNLTALKNDIIKIDDKQLPGKLDFPQVIGRFRVLKTDILKISTENIFTENYDTFKLHLRDIIISHNALNNTINVILSKSESENLDLN